MPRPMAMRSAMVCVAAVRGPNCLRRRPSTSRGIGHHHLLGADREHAIVGARADHDMREVERGRGGGAGVLDIEDRRVAEAGAVERRLSANAVLAFERALGRVGEDDGLRRADGCRARRPPAPRAAALRGEIGEATSRESARTASCRRRRCRCPAWRVLPDRCRFVLHYCSMIVQKRARCKPRVGRRAESREERHVRSRAAAKLEPASHSHRQRRRHRGARASSCSRNSRARSPTTSGWSRPTRRSRAFRTRSR